jgi:ketosteroid isomerase-like protein
MSTPSEVIDRYIAAMRSGDYETGFGFFAEDVVFRIPGRSEWAGEHKGRDAAVAYSATRSRRPTRVRWNSS